MEQLVKKWWPKALEITLFILLMLFTMKSELGTNGDLIDRNHQDIVKMQDTHDKLVNSTTRMEVALDGIAHRISSLEYQHRIQAAPKQTPGMGGMGGMSYEFRPDISNVKLEM